MRQGRIVAAAVGFPLASITTYLLWIWPLPRGASVLAQTGPYILSLLTGVPFVWRLTRRSGRIAVLATFLGGGFILLWLYALAMLCGLRDRCL